MPMDHKHRGKAELLRVLKNRELRVEYVVTVAVDRTLEELHRQTGGAALPYAEARGTGLGAMSLLDEALLPLEARAAK